MLATHHILIFSMLYLILIHFFNFEKKRSVGRVNVIIVILLAISDIIRQIHYGYQPIRSYDSLIGLFFIFFACLYMLNGLKIWFAWVAIIISFFLSFFISEISTGFIFSILGIDVTLIQFYAQYSVLNVFLGFLLLLLLYQVIKLLGLTINVFSLTMGDVILMLLFISLFGFYVAGSYQLGIDSGGIRGGLIKTSTLLGGLIGTYLIVYLATQKSTVKDIQGRKKQQELIFYEQEQSYQRMLSKDAELKKFRHGITDELAFLQSLLNSHAIHEAQAYVKTMQNGITKMDQEAGEETGSRATNTSWHALTNNTKYSDVTATWLGKIPLHLPMEDRDLVLLFSNLLSNAFEAAVRSLGEKYVEVEITKKSGTVSLSVKNSYSGKIKIAPNGDFVSSKPNKESHGIGTRIIKEIVEKYHGEISFHEIESNFTVLILFDEVISEKL